MVCTAPLTHAGIITELLQNGLPVFTELNLVPDGYEENIALAKEKGLPLFLSSVLHSESTQGGAFRLIQILKRENLFSHKLYVSNSNKYSIEVSKS